MDPCSSFAEETQEDIEQDVLDIVKGCYQKAEDSVEKPSEAPYKSKYDQESMMSVLEQAERERQERIMLNMRPKPQNTERQERLSVNARPMRPRRTAAFDLGIPVQESEFHWPSRRLQFDEGTTSGHNNDLTEPQEDCANEDQPLSETSVSSLDYSMEEIVLDGKEIN